MSSSDVECSSCSETVPQTLLILHLKKCLEFFSVDKSNFSDFKFLQYFVCGYILGQINWDSFINLTQFLKFEVFEIYRFFLEVHFDRYTKPWVSDKFLRSVLLSITYPDDQRLEIVPDAKLSDFKDFFIFKEDLNYIFSNAQIRQLENRSSFLDR